MIDGWNMIALSACALGMLMAVSIIARSIHTLRALHAQDRRNAAIAAEARARRKAITDG